MSLTAAELALFGEPAREPGSDDGDPTPAVDVSKLVPLASPVDDPALPVPEKKKRTRRQAIMPDCQACGASLNPDNASQLRAGEWKHIGCPATGALFTQSATPPPAPAVVDSTETDRVEAAKIAEALNGAKPGEAIVVETPSGSYVVRIELGPYTLQALAAILRK